MLNDSQDSFPYSYSSFASTSLIPIHIVVNVVIKKKKGEEGAARGARQTMRRCTMLNSFHRRNE